MKKGKIWGGIAMSGFKGIYSKAFMSEIYRNNSAKPLLHLC